METTKNYPNLTDAEKKWLVLSAALRPDASVDDLINSFLVVFPDRTQHDGLTEKQIRETLTSRVNDILYRKERGYAPCIAEKRNDMQRAFDAGFAVLNPLALMNFYEQTFTDPKSKPSDKFKAINDAEKLKARLFPPPTDQQQKEIDRQQTRLKKKADDTRTRVYWRVYRKRLRAVYDALPETLQKEIDTYPDADEYSDREIMDAVLERQGNLTEQRAALSSDLPVDWAEFLSAGAILEIDAQLSNGGIDEMTPDALDALIHSYLDRERKAAINALKLP
ncbi:hypothetical protein F4Z98_03375 [Candidatus Poribacteria bacterium]|nr:hypothetical protein [Candidatus Poribacteria bacterium]MYA99404.1 hypothetical protein [Candidatus Poribacteria bacterium]MYI35003.1 hypothetical protein [Acidimicrobiaceae bacterium]